jgi:hypothetical protein
MLYLVTANILLLLFESNLIDMLVIVGNKQKPRQNKLSRLFIDYETTCVKHVEKCSGKQRPSEHGVKVINYSYTQVTE